MTTRPWTILTPTSSASYEVDFWGGKSAARDSAVQALKASEFDHATVELTLLSSVANSYVQTLAFNEQLRIARLNLANAQSVMHVVQTRYDAGSATAVELAQQKSLVASQQRQLPLVEQQAQRRESPWPCCLANRCKALFWATLRSTSCNGHRLAAACPANC